MGPLSRLWNMVEEANASKQTQVCISLDDMKKHIEKTVLLLGQASNSITYQRRYNALLGVMGSAPKVKEMLRTDADMLQKHDKDLFGKKFREHLTETSKSKKKALEAFGNNKKKLPFRGGPLSQQQRRGGGGQQRFVFNRNRQTNMFESARQRPYFQHGGPQQQQQRFSGKKKLTDGNYSQQIVDSTSYSTFGTESSTPTSKKLVLCKNYSKCPISWKTKILHISMGKTDKRSRSLVLCKRLSNTVSERTETTQNSSTSPYEQGTKTIDRCGSKRNAEKRSHCPLFTETEGAVSEQYLSSIIIIIIKIYLLLTSECIHIQNSSFIYNDD